MDYFYKILLNSWEDLPKFISSSKEISRILARNTLISYVRSYRILVLQDLDKNLYQNMSLFYCVWVDLHRIILLIPHHLYLIFLSFSAFIGSEFLITQHLYFISWVLWQYSGKVSDNIPSIPYFLSFDVFIVSKVFDNMLSLPYFLNFNVILGGSFW